MWVTLCYFQNVKVEKKTKMTKTFEYVTSSVRLCRIRIGHKILVKSLSNRMVSYEWVGKSVKRKGKDAMVGSSQASNSFCFFLMKKFRGFKLFSFTRAFLLNCIYILYYCVYLNFKQLNAFWLLLCFWTPLSASLHHLMQFRDLITCGFWIWKTTL